LLIQGSSVIVDTDDTKSDVDSEMSQKKKKASIKKDGEKKKQKNALKQLQDRLLEEAKKKMGSSNPSKETVNFLKILASEKAAVSVKNLCFQDSPQPTSNKASFSSNHVHDSDTDEKNSLNSQVWFLKIAVFQSF